MGWDPLIPVSPVRWVTYDRCERALGRTVHHFRPSKIPFIHHAALTLTHHHAATPSSIGSENERRDAEGVIHPVSVYAPFAKGRTGGGRRGTYNERSCEEVVG